MDIPDINLLTKVLYVDNNLRNMYQSINLSMQDTLALTLLKIKCSIYKTCVVLTWVAHGLHMISPVERINTTK